MGDAFHSMYSKVFTLEIIAHLYVFWIKIRWALSSTFALRDVRITCEHFHFTGILVCRRHYYQITIETLFWALFGAATSKSKASAEDVWIPPRFRASDILAGPRGIFKAFLRYV